MVNRSNNNANTNGGVAYVNSNNAPSNTNANIGSRLAHRKNFKRSSQPKDEKIAGQRLCIAITPQPVEPYQAFRKPPWLRAVFPHYTVKEVEHRDTLGHGGE